MSAPKSSPEFSETLWFKQGEADAAVAQAAAQGVTVDVEGAAVLPIEDRYLDNGSVTKEDSQRFSLRTGTTQVFATIALPPPPRAVTERELIREMTGTHGRLIAAVLMLAIAVAAFVATSIILIGR
jgi:hypothetical protein